MLRNDLSRRLNRRCQFDTVRSPKTEPGQIDG